MARTQKVALSDGTVTWTVVDDQWALVEPVEEYLEFARNSSYSPNTVRAYAQGLALWWTHLSSARLGWEAVTPYDLAGFMRSLRTRTVGVAALDFQPAEPVAEATIAARMRAVLSFYRFHRQMGRDVNSFDGDGRRSGNYLPFLAHLSRQSPGAAKGVIRLRVPRPGTQIIEPQVVDALLQAEAQFDPVSREWVGDIRYRLFWGVLFETGLRIGEALSLQHRDWQTGRGGIGTVSVTPRPHPHGYQLKSGARTIPITDELDALYGDYVWWLCEQGADQVLDDWDSSYIFCNTRRDPLFAPTRAESIYDHLEVMKRRVPGLNPDTTPHWFRHTHATAMLLAGVPPHVVSRRLGHANIQTTLDTYGHVTDDAELQALADWESVTRPWRGSLNGE